MQTVALDFDGPIHRYREGWKDGSIYDFPVMGVEDALKKLLEKHPVFILSSRDSHQIAEWMKEKFPSIPVEVIDDKTKFWTASGVIGITNRKLAATVYVDDRALKFFNWSQVLREVK
jgi:5'(3')-deoxyribonucleotidase